MAGFTPHRRVEGNFVRRSSDTYRFTNKRGKDKRSEDKKFYEKDLEASVNIVTGYDYTELIINLDLK